jgi:hypothetical protein
MATVSYPPAVMEKLRRWGNIAVRTGLRVPFVAALREMADCLQSQPESWGDPLKDYRALKLTYYRHYGPILVVHYAVHIDGSPVLVWDVELTPNSQLHRLDQ